MTPEFRHLRTEDNAYPAQFIETRPGACHAPRRFDP
jgi:hypothetical protein